MAYPPIPMPGRPNFRTMTAGPQNPFAPPDGLSQWWSNGGSQFAGDALSDFGYGLATSSSIGNAFGAATRRSAELSPQRNAEREDRRNKNTTIETFKKMPALH